MTGLRIVLHLPQLTVGGLQVVVADLAAELVRRGHHVTVVALPGPIMQRLVSDGVEVVVPRTSRPDGIDPVRIASLRRTVRRGADVVHAFDTKATVESLYATLGTSTALSATSMSPFVPWYLPAVPLTVPTPGLVRIVGASHDAPVHHFPPTVDLVEEGVDTDRSLLRERGLADVPTLVVVSRLASEFKVGGLLLAMHAAAELRREGHQLQLLVVGDGPARPQLEAHAERVNAEVGAGTVVMLGELSEPGPAYAAADIVLGVGGALLRGMARGKPAVCLGRAGYAVAVDAESAPGLCDRMFYGVGDGGDGVGDAVEAIRPLLVDPAARRRAGQFARALVEEEFGLRRHAVLFERMLVDAVDEHGPPTWRDALRTPLGMWSYRRLTTTRRRQAEALGMSPEQVANYVLLHARNHRLPEHLRGTWPETPTPRWR